MIKTGRKLTKKTMIREESPESIPSPSAISSSTTEGTDPSEVTWKVASTYDSGTYYVGEKKTFMGRGVMVVSAFHNKKLNTWSVKDAVTETDYKRGEYWIKHLKVQLGLGL